MGVDAWIYCSFSEVKLTPPSSWGIEGENKRFDQGTVLLHGGEDGEAREIIPFCSLVGSSGAAKLTPLLPGVDIPFPVVKGKKYFFKNRFQKFQNDFSNFETPSLAVSKFKNAWKK